MSQIPRQLIRQVQICTRSSSGLSDYNPSDPTLPALPHLSAAIAASNSSPPQFICKNCRGMLLRGSESIICVYCGLGPHYDAVPDPISFSSTVAYQWLLRSLHLDGSEMIDPTNKTEVFHLGYNSPKTLTPLSDFLNFKIPWLAEKENQVTRLSEKKSDQSEGSLRLIGVAPDKFFSKSKKNAISDNSNEQLFNHYQIRPNDGKDVAAVEYHDLFQNAQLPEPSGRSSQHKSAEASSEWEAEFQDADSENNFEDPKSFDISMDLGSNLADHIDSVFGSGKSLNDRKPEENPAVVPAFDDWNSDAAWNNMSAPHFSGGFDTAVSTMDDPQVDRTSLVYLKDDSVVDHTSFVYSKDSNPDLFQDFQSEANDTGNTKNKVINDENTTLDGDLFEEWNDFTGSTGLQFPSQNV